MSTTQTKSGTSDDCGYDAAEWFVRLQAPDLSTEDLEEWERWMARPANRAAFDEIQHLAERAVGGMAPRRRPAASELAQDRYDGSIAVAEWLAQHQLPSSEADRARSSSPGTTSRFLAFAAIVAVVTTGVLLWANGRLPSGAPAEQLEVYETVAAEHRDITLADGSMIALAAKSAVSVSFSAERRLVALNHGEAWFQVARDLTRPFTVVAGGGTITAVGTAFNVRRGVDEVVVTVTEGRVDVVQPPTSAGGDSSERTTATLVAGQEVSYGVRGELREVKRTDPGVAAAWREGRLEYRSEPLKRVIPDVNRYLRKEIVVVDPEIGDYMFTGTVFQGYTDGWIRGLEEIYPVEVVDRGDNQILVRKRDGF